MHKYSLWESWWHIGFEDNSGLKREGKKGLIIRENVIVLYGWSWASILTRMNFSTASRASVFYVSMAPQAPTQSQDGVY